MGFFNTQLMRQVFTKYRYFHQKGNNSWGGVIVLIKLSIPSSSIKYKNFNVGVVEVEVEVERIIRRIGIYAPRSVNLGIGVPFL